MTNLDKWKKERIKKIEEMYIYEVALNIEDNMACEDFCINGLKEPINGSWCKLPDNERVERNCLKGITEYLESEVE